MKTIILFSLFILSPILLKAQTNYALNFDGFSAYVDCGDNAALNITGTAITLEAWIYPTYFADNSWDNVIIGKDGEVASKKSGYTLRCGGSGQLSFTFGGNSTWSEVLSSYDALKLNTWQHVAGVYDGSAMKVYVNGDLKGTSTVSNAIYNNLSLPLYIGDSPGFSPRLFGGYIDEVRIWNIARSQVQIQSTKNSELIGNESGLLAYYKMSNGSGTFLTENTGSGNTGTIYDATWITSALALPVELTSFTASTNKSNVTLNWQTATEVNNYGFNVERASTSLGMTWEKIGFIQGHGNSNSPKSYSFTDANPPSGTVQYRLKQIDFDGRYEYSDVVEVNVETPASFSLNQNYPNPCNPTTVISYQVQAASHVTIKVYDLLGREVAALVNEMKSPGNYELTFDGSKLASGVYTYTMNAGNYTSTKKMILIK